MSRADAVRGMSWLRYAMSRICWSCMGKEGVKCCGCRSWKHSQSGVYRFDLRMTHSEAAGSENCEEQNAVEP